MNKEVDIPLMTLKIVTMDGKELIVTAPCDQFQSYIDRINVPGGFFSVEIVNDQDD